MITLPLLFAILVFLLSFIQVHDDFNGNLELISSIVIYAVFALYLVFGVIL